MPLLTPKKNHRLVSASGKPIQVCYFGEVDYLAAETKMREFASSRSEQDLDQIWMLQHPPVYTQGTSCQQIPFLNDNIPIVKTDRGGQITYHGPGQLVMYPLLDLRRFGVGIKALVFKLEQSVIDLLESYNLPAQRRENAPGVYLDEAKIAALGLRIRKGNSYHGLSLNVDMDLAPFSNIDPCGFRGLEVTQLANQANLVSFEQVTEQLLECFIKQI